MRTLIAAYREFRAIAVGQNETAEIKIIHRRFGPDSFPVGRNFIQPRNELENVVIDRSKPGVHSRWRRPLGHITETRRIGIRWSGSEREGESGPTPIREVQSHVSSAS